VAETTRDTIYIDIDDEITGIIDKVRSSDAKIIALVLPKRASVFQSVVNMKLLMRATEQAKKHIVLITAEAGLLPLAGAVGMYVARTLNSKPEIPAAPLADDGREEMVEESASLEDDELTTTVAGDKPIGELAGLTPPLADEVETVELDDDEDDLPIAAAAVVPAAALDKKAAKAAKKAKKDNKLKVPNFERFRLVIILGMLIIIALIVGGYFVLSALPKATISVQTDASNVNTSVNLTLDPNASSLNTQSNDVPAKQVTEQKTYTASVPATGQQNNGQVATGSVTFTLTNCSQSSVTIPAGTGVSANNLTYITQSSVTLTSVSVGNKCDPPNFSSYYSGSTDITAQSPGSNYNTSGTVPFSVSGVSDVNSTGSASGGTSDIVTVIQQSDISNAEGKITTNTSGAKSDLEQQLQQDNLYAIPATFVTGNPAISPSSAVGSPASNVTVTETITYSMYGAPVSDLNTLLTNNIKSQVNTSQGIISTGLTDASFTTTGSSGTALTMVSTAEVGPNISVSSVKQQAEGKKSGDAEAAIKSDADVTNVTVSLSPFWVSSVPKNLSKITVNVAQPTGTANNGSNS
jgi:hypothetical protein